MFRSLRRAQVLRIGFAVLLLVSAVQVAWWMLDQWWFTEAVESRLRELHADQVAAAQRLLAAGETAAQVEALLPAIVVAEGEARLDPRIGAQLREERDRRIARYLWEGGFFLVVLLGALGVIGKALREERALRRRQDNFLAGVSHELKSPLAAARVAAETLVLRDPPAALREQQLRRIRRNLGRLEAMIGNLLDTVRLEAGELALEPEHISLEEAVAPVLAAFAERAEENGVMLANEIPEDLEIRADVAAFRTVLRNLLENAFTAVAERTLPSVRVSAAAAADEVRIAVSDNGCGFAPEEAARLFEKFYRPGDELRRGGHGAGLGLHIVAQIAAVAGARVEASSGGVGSGAVFTVRWPGVQPT